MSPGLYGPQDRHGKCPALEFIIDAERAMTICQFHAVELACSTEKHMPFHRVELMGCLTRRVRLSCIGRLT
ncbi:hypothetical protein CUJ87_21355 [Paraburkholderia caledonica]|nr:hypothetical protein CUJ87_21355 [Paraburkholderia caledonica]